MAGTADAAQYRYPQGLPWLQFLDRDLGIVLKHIEFVPKPRKTVTGILADHEATRKLLQIVQQPDVVSLSNSQKSRLMPAVFEQLVRKSLGITVRSEGMVMQLLARKSIDHLAAQFDMVLPQAYPDENLRRAATLAGGSIPDIQVELLKILLFLMSNRLILDGWHYDEYHDARQIVTLCQLSGLSQLQSLQRLVGLSHRSLTMTAVINTLFKAAVLTGAAGFACNLLKADYRLRPDKMTGLWVRYGRIAMRGISSGTPLEFALTKQYGNLVTVLIDAGSKLPSYAYGDWSLLAVAFYENFPPALIELVRQNGAHINGSRFEAIHAAFITGNLPLVERLVSQGADLNRRYRGSPVKSSAAPLDPFVASDYFHVIRHVYDVGCLGLAASFHSANVTTRSKTPVDLWESFAEDQDKALELCRAIHSKYRLQMDLSDSMTADAMILASARGYTKVIEFLYNEFSASVNTPSGHLSPLYAAVGWKQAEAAQLLISLGAYPCPPTACTVATPYTHYQSNVNPEVECPAPSLLQIAIAQGSCELAEILVRGGVDINEEREIALRDKNIHWPPLAGPSVLDSAMARNNDPISRARLRPIQLAVLSKKWNVGLMLLQNGATASANELFNVALEGQPSLVEQLLDAGISPTEAVKDDITAYEAALYNGHGLLAARLAAAGGGDPAPDFASVFRIPDAQHIETHVPPSLLREPWKMGRDREGRSYLENAILSHDEEVIRMVLDLDVTAYDSGALCAEVLSLITSGQKTASPVLKELLRRRSLGPESSHVNLALENHAVSIAAWHACPNIIAALLKCPPSDLTQSLAILAYPKTELSGFPVDSESSLPLWFEGPPFNDSDAWHASRSIMVSPLLFAVEGNASEEMSEILLNAGYKADGFTLRAAIIQELPFGLIERILKNCYDVEAKCAIDVRLIPQSDGIGSDQTPLSVAVILGRVDVVKALLAHHADINARRGILGYTALWYAIWYRRLHIADLLLDRGAEVNEPVRSAVGGSVLRLAAGMGLIGLVQRLFARGADLNAYRSEYCIPTALESAAGDGRLDTVYFLLEAGTDTEGYGRVQYVCATGLAFKRGHGAVVELLKGHREWTSGDFAIWNQLYPADMMTGFYHLPSVHPLELPLGELFNRLAELYADRHEDYKSYSDCGCFAALPRKCDHLIASLIKNRVAKVADKSHDKTMSLLEEAARFAIQAVRSWAEESGTPLPCSSIWNAEDGALRRPVEACSVCGFKVWYYLPCSLQSRTEEVADMVAQSLVQWSPSSWLEETRKDGGVLSGDVTIPGPTDTEPFEKATQDSPVWRFGEWDEITTEHDTIPDTIEDGPIHSYSTSRPKPYDDGLAVNGGDEWEEQWAIILAEMTGNQELSFTPMDYEW
jgi:ankyrin repeat protein